MKKPPTKKYNIADRQEVPNCRKFAVFACRCAGFSYKTIAYTLGIGPDRVRGLEAKHLRLANLTR